MTLTGEIIEMGDLTQEGDFGIRMMVTDGFFNHVVTMSGLTREEVASLAPLLFLDVVVTVEEEESAPDLLSALKLLDGRLRECFGHPITAQEAYDSFYQEEVRAAIAKASPKETT